MKKINGKGISDSQVDQIAAKINQLSLPDIIRVMATLSYEAGIPIIMAHLQNDSTGEFSTPIREKSTKKKGFDIRFTSHGFPPEDVDGFITKLTNSESVERVVTNSNSVTTAPIADLGLQTQSTEEDRGEEDEEDEENAESLSKEELMKRLIDIRNQRGDKDFSDLLIGFVVYKCKEAIVNHYSKLISLGAFN